MPGKTKLARPSLGAGALAASFLLAIAAVSAALAQAPPAPPQSTIANQQHPVVVFMTDFGNANDAAAICRAVIHEIAPGARIDDVTHSVTPYSVADGARFLAGVTPYYGPGAVFLVVIDPGVGSARKAVVVKTRRDQYFVLPDNGLMTLVAARDGVEGIREITNPKWMIRAKLSSTFHGRDIFSPAAAHLARGDNWRDAGPAVPSLVQLELHAPHLDAEGITGEVIALDDPFGNLITNVSGEDFKKLGYAVGDTVRLRIGERTFDVPYVRTFSDVAPGKPLAFIDSRGRFSLAVNQGDFAKAFGLKPPCPLVVARKQ
jgi:S-adenosylmethionine hydrolase